MKNRTLIGIICIVAALALTFGVAPLINRVSDGKTEIVRMVSDVQRGKIITEADIETISVGSYNLPKNILKSKSDVVGKYASTDIYSGEYILPSKLTAANTNTLDSLDGTKQAISVTISSFAAGISGKLQKSGIISIIVYNSKDGAVIPEELKYVQVITTTTSAMQDQGEAKEGVQPATVTLLVNAEQANLLVGYEQTSKLHFTLVYRGNADTAQQLIDLQDALWRTGDTGEVTNDE